MMQPFPNKLLHRPKINRYIKCRFQMFTSKTSLIRHPKKKKTSVTHQLSNFWTQKKQHRCNSEGAPTPLLNSGPFSFFSPNACRCQGDPLCRWCFCFFLVGLVALYKFITCCPTTKNWDRISSWRLNPSWNTNKFEAKQVEPQVNAYSPQLNMGCGCNYQGKGWGGCPPK